MAGRELGAVLLAAALLGCEDPPVKPAPGGGAPLGSALPAAASDTGCRVIAMQGDARRGSRALGARELIAGGEPIELGPDASLHLKHTESAREWTFRGPLRLSACGAGSEELALGLGALQSELGQGARPGAEVWIGTPFGSLRYADARARVDVSDSSLTVAVDAGELWLDAAPGPDARDAELVLRAGQRAERRHRHGAESATLTCSDAAARAEADARALLEPGGDALGARAKAHVRSRQRARAACLTALAAVLEAGPGPERTAQLERLSGAAAVWRRVPTRARAVP